MWVVHSLNADTDLKTGDLRKRLIEHARDPKAVTRNIAGAAARAESPFEEAVIKRLIVKQYEVRPQWKVGRYRIDMVVQDGSRRLAVECDGDRYHGPEKMADDMNRQAILERLGWKFHRIRGTEFFRDPDAAMNRLFARLGELNIQPSAKTDTKIAQTDSESLTDHLIRRAAEIRRSWDDPEGESVPDLLRFHPEANDVSDGSIIEQDEPVVDEPSAEISLEEEVIDDAGPAQAQLPFEEPEDVTSDVPLEATVPLEYLDRTESQIVNLLRV